MRLQGHSTKKPSCSQPILPFQRSPPSDQTYEFALGDADYGEEKRVVLTGSAKEVLQQRLLPVYDRFGDLVVPRLYHCLVGAVVEVKALAVRVRDQDMDEEGFYFEVKYMRVLSGDTRNM